MVSRIILKFLIRISIRTRTVYNETEKIIRYDKSMERIGDDTHL